MTRISKDELLDLMEQCRTALVKEQDAHTQTKAALAAAIAKLEAVEGLRDRWMSEGVVLAPNGSTAGACIQELTAALASPGPSLRERVEKAVEEIRGRGSADYNSERAFAYGASADLVQAALEGE